MYSQAGYLIGFIPEDQVGSIGAVPVSCLDWRSRASARVSHSIFGAETVAALETIGMAQHIRAFYCDVLIGGVPGIEVTGFGEDQLRVLLFTDCRSLCDNHMK